MSRTANRHRPPAQMADFALGAAQFLAVALAAAAWTFLIGRILGLGV
jgi:hypothetical protein